MCASIGRRPDRKAEREPPPEGIVGDSGRPSFRKARSAWRAAGRPCRHIAEAGRWGILRGGGGIGAGSPGEPP